MFRPVSRVLAIALITVALVSTVNTTRTAAAQDRPAAASTDFDYPASWEAVYEMFLDALSDLFDFGADSPAQKVAPATQKVSPVLQKVAPRAQKVRSRLQKVRERIQKVAPAAQKFQKVRG